MWHNHNRIWKDLNYWLFNTQTTTQHTSFHFHLWSNSLIKCFHAVLWYLDDGWRLTCRDEDSSHLAFSAASLTRCSAMLSLVKSTPDCNDIKHINLDHMRPDQTTLFRTALNQQLQRKPLHNHWNCWAWQQLQHLNSILLKSTILIFMFTNKETKEKPKES